MTVIDRKKSPSPRAVDPTRTTLLRLQATRAVRRKFGLLKGMIYKLVVGEDAFGLVERRPYVFNVENCQPGQMREAGGRCGPGIGVSIPRAEMPQIRGDDVQEFLRYVRTKGVDLSHKEVTADDLSPTQSEFRQERVDAIPASKLRDPILVSKDLYVLDGTHRWVKHWQSDRKAQVPVVVLDLDLRPALELMRGFPKVKFVENSFCPTGPGGGVDPTCSPGGVKAVTSIKEMVKLQFHYFKASLESGKYGDVGKEMLATLDQKKFEKNWKKTLKGKDPDPVLVVDIQKSIDIAYKEYDIPKVPIFIRKLGPEENAHWDNGFMVIGEDAQSDNRYRSSVKELSDPRKSTVKDAYPDMVAGIVVHELGHKYHDDNPHTIQYARSILQEERRDIAERISDYASTRAEELIAEAYAMSKHPGYRNLPVETRSLVSRVLSGGRFTTTNAGRWQFRSSPEKLKAFQEWLRQQFKAVLLGHTDEELWAEFARQGFMKGANRAFEDVNKKVRWAPGKGDFYEGSRQQFLKSSFGRPESVDKLKLLASRSFTDLINVSEDMATRMGRTLMDGLARGANPRTLIKPLMKDLDVSRDRAETIARTECLPAETLVDAAVVRAVFRRWYDGDMVDIVTRSGRKFSATPNHPMLTTMGWVFAGKLKSGDNLVRYDRKQGPSLGRDPDVVGEPTTIGEIFDSLNAVGVIERKSSSNPDFHGDGREGYVDILCPDGELMIGSFAPLSKPVAEDVFTPSGIASSSFCPKCSRLLPVNKSICLCFGTEVNVLLGESTFNEVPVYSEVGGDLDQGLSGLVSSSDSVNVQVGTVLVANPPFLPGEKLSFRNRAADSMNPENLTNLLLVRPDLICDLPLSQPGEIELDNVVSVTLRPFTGHVFNLETPFGYFNIQGYYTGNTIRAHAEGQLDAMEQLGVTEVGVAVEWSTAAGTGATEDQMKAVRVCPKCSVLSGVVLTIQEAHGVIPVHPRCRCSFIPANVGESTKGQKRSKAEIEKAFVEADENPPELDDVRPAPLIEPTENQEFEFDGLESLVEYWKEKV